MYYVCTSITRNTYYILCLFFTRMFAKWTRPRTGGWRRRFCTDSPPPARSLLTLADVLRAQRNIRGAVPVTTCVRNSALSEQLGMDLFFKRDHQLRTGSFKERGARNALALFLEREPGLARGVGEWPSHPQTHTQIYMPSPLPSYSLLPPRIHCPRPPL